jgi:hypothetical protein
MLYGLEFAVFVRDYAVFVEKRVCNVIIRSWGSFKRTRLLQMMQVGETIQTLRPDGRKGVTLLKSAYERLSAQILEVLDREAEAMTFHALLEKVLPGSTGDAAWEVLQIKLDLEARGFIKVYTPPYEKRAFYLKLTAKGQRRMR